MPSQAPDYLGPDPRTLGTPRGLALSEGFFLVCPKSLAAVAISVHSLRLCAQRRENRRSSPQLRLLAGREAFRKERGGTRRSMGVAAKGVHLSVVRVPEKSEVHRYRALPNCHC